MSPMNDDHEISNEKASHSQSSSHLDTNSDKEGGDVHLEDSIAKPEVDEGVDHNWGRLVIDPEEAKIEFGEERASRLKRTPDGKWICWPQP